MPTLNIDGFSPVTVDASFLDLSPADQEKTVGEIRASLGSSRPAAPASPVASPDAASQFGEGIADIGRGFNATTRQTVGSERAPAVAPDTGPNAIGNVVEGVRSGNWGQVRDNAGPALARVAPDVGAGLGAAGAGFMVGGPVGALVGGGLYAAGRSLGDNIETRARNNKEIGPDGNLSPSTSSQVMGGLTTAATSAFDAVGSAGLGTARRALTGAAPAIERGLVGRTGAALRDTATEGVTGAASDVIQQAGTSVGTAEGLSVDPVQAAVGGMLESGARGSMSLPGAVGRGSLETAARIGGERAMGDLTVDRAASVERVMGTVDRLRGASDSPDRPLEDHINTAREEVKAEVHSLLEKGRDLGFYDDQEYRAQAALFRTAADHNKVLSEGKADSDGNSAFGLSRIDKLSAPVEFKSLLREHLTDLDTIATAARKKNVTGSFEKFGDIAGRVAGVVGGGMAGGLPGAIAGGAAAMVANPLHARIGSFLGRKLDNAMGTRSPAIALARGKAQEILAKAGRTDVGDTLGGLKRTNDILNDPIMSARYSMNLPVDPESVSRSSLQKAQARISAGLQPKDDQFDRMTPADRAKMQEWLDFRGKTEAKSSSEEAALAKAAETQEDAVASARVRTALKGELDAPARGQDPGPAPADATLPREALQAAQRASSTPGAPQAPPVPPVGGGLAPEVPPPSGDYGAKALPGWMAGVRSFVQSKGAKAPNRAVIMQAVDDLETVGHFDSDEADAIRAAPQRVPREMQQAITARVGELVGAPDLHDRPDVTYTQGAPNAAYWNGVARPAAWESAKEARQSYISDAIAQTRETDPGMGATLGMFQVMTDTQMSPEAKVAMARATIAAAKDDPAVKARREAVLNPLIALYRKKD